ncbi:iron ABC transporter permease [Oleispirillum naphthae]|uniref:FecCD family ABC transporter permease n=1 Tax=Oleispirillum naphthae TaxID=2838853 RepID=UPI0030824CB9
MKRLCGAARAAAERGEARAFALLVGIVLLVFAWNAASGALAVPLSAFPRIFGAALGLCAPQEGDRLFAMVLLEVRLPRLCLAGAVGAILGFSGAAMQGVLRNPLAEPGLLGTSSGAALGAVAAIVLEGVLTRRHDFAPFMVPLAAFGGAMASTVVVVAVARAMALPSATTLLLTGIAINALAGSAIGLLISLANDEQLRSLTFWMMGSLASANWVHAGVVSAVGAVSGAFVFHQALALDATTLGDDVAGHLGLDAVAVRGRVLGAVALAVGAAVAFVGMIGFVGLVAPHLVRLMLGARHRLVIPGAMLLGAVLVMLADMAARTVAIPAELPLGVLTGILGGPFLLWLLLRVGRQGGAA